MTLENGDTAVDSAADGGSALADPKVGTTPAKADAPSAKVDTGSTSTPAKADAGSTKADGASISLRSQLVDLAPEEAREDLRKWVERYTDDGKWAEALLHLRNETFKRPAIPGEDASPEDRHKYFRQLGKPDKPEEYEFTLSEEQDADEAFKASVEEFRKFAFENDLTAKQAKGLLAFYAAREEAMKEYYVKKIQEARGATAEALQKKWGPDYEANLAQARIGGSVLFNDEEAWSRFVNTPTIDGRLIGDIPELIEAMAQFGRSMSDDPRHARLSITPATSESIQAQIDAIEKEAMEKGKSPADPEYHERLAPLYKKLYPARYVVGRNM